jgi:transcription elongation factor Elf1
MKDHNNYNTVECWVCETEHFITEVKEHIKDNLYTCPNCKTQTEVKK